MWLTPRKRSGIGGSQVARYDNALYPQAYGATGDGVTDDTVALQTWLDATEALGRRGVIPAGTYCISETLIVRGNGGAIEGAGRNLSVLQWVGAADDGSSMVQWSRANGALSGVSLDGAYLASNGLLLHSGHGTEFRGLHVLRQEHHGVVLDNLLPDEDYGFNEGVVFNQLNVENCGHFSTLRVRAIGATGGTYTLTVDGQTTAPIAHNATAAQIIAALLAANPSDWTNDDGSNPFDWEQGDAQDTGVTFRLYGTLAGAAPPVSGDFSGLTGPVTEADFTYLQEGKAGDGVTMLPSEGGGADNGTVSFIEPQIRGIAGGHGMRIIGQGIKIVGGHIEGNGGAGIYFGDAAASSTTDCLVLWPWLENNERGGVVADKAVGSVNRVLVVNAEGYQTVEDTSGITFVSGNSGRFATHARIRGGFSLGLSHLTAQSLYSLDGAGTPRSIEVQTKNEKTEALYAHTVAGGGIVLDMRTSNIKVVRLEADAAWITMAVPQVHAEIQLFLEHSGAARTITSWLDAISWIGGAPPTLGSGGNASVDILRFMWVNGLYRQVAPLVTVQ